MTKKKANPNQMDMFPPESSWTAPAELPFVPDETLIALDTETRDNGLAEGRGPGWVTKDGHICGVSYAYEVGGQLVANYVPVRHPDTPDCHDLGTVLNWVDDVMRRCRVVFQNASYDIGWINPNITRRFDDTHTAGVLLDENRLNYSLDALCRWQGVEVKNEHLLREAAAALGLDAKGELWRMPARYVGPYATQDAVSTLRLMQVMRPQLIGQGLTEAYELETDLAPHVIKMRRRGIRINVERAERLQEQYREMTIERLRELRTYLGVNYRREITIQDVRSPKWLEMCFNDIGIAFPRTPGTKSNPLGNPSFEKEWLERQNSPVASLIVEARKLNDAAEKFVGNYILDHLERGRLHAEIHQLRDSDDSGSKGTRSWRFSYSNPPLQQMNRAEPDKTDPNHKDYVPGFVDVGSEIRGCFEAEPGEVVGAPDYSGQEFRRICEVAYLLKLRKADEVVAAYQANPRLDFHQWVADQTHLPRKKAKDCNFAKAFGAGVVKFSEMTGMTLDDAKDVMNQYDRELPFVKDLADKCAQRAADVGYIRLLDGRRCRFDMWEPSFQEKGEFVPPCDLTEARRRTEDPNHPWYRKRIRRAYTHKAGNRRIQGDSAIQTKKAMLLQANEGMLPMLQMHDELVHSVPNKRYADRIVECMIEAIQQNVPVVVDAEHGTNWGNAKYTYEEAVRMLKEGK